jgi:micrococcal nuclease
MRVRRALVAVTLIVALGSCASDRATGPSARGVGVTAATDGPFRVVKVVDGDTIKVAHGGTETVRLIGIDTPEVVDPRQPVQCFGREASAHAHHILDGTSVSLEYDASQGRRDRFGRTLAYVRLADGRLFNEMMIADGYAFEYTYDLPYRYQASFQKAERGARAAQRGLWAPTTCAGRSGN